MGRPKRHQSVSARVPQLQHTLRQAAAGARRPHTLSELVLELVVIVVVARQG